MRQSTELEALGAQLEQLTENYKEIVQRMKENRENVRLSRREVADVMGYNRDYIYGIEPAIPFKSNHIYWHDLLEYTRKHKPNRLKRAKENIKKYQTQL